MTNEQDPTRSSNGINWPQTLMFIIPIMEEMSKSNELSQLEREKVKPGRDSISKKSPESARLIDWTDDNWETNFSCLVVYSSEFDEWVKQKCKEDASYCK